MPEPGTPASAASAPTFNPFPGLRAFEPDEDYLYFGREKQIDELLRRLGDTRFLSVVGTSGSGKSSLVRAGLVPSLYSGILTRAGSSWRVAIMRPGGDPMGNLAAALDDPAVLGGDMGETGRRIIESTLRASSLGLADCVGQALIPDQDNVLVVVDQFEELFRFKSSSRGSRDEAVAFVKLLLAAAESEAHLYVVLTMRSDFIGDCMELPGLPEAINQGQYLVPRMTRDELRLAIAAPVGVGGAEISPRLVSRLLNDIEDNRDQLPVLQHALMRMWSYWESHRGDPAILDLDHYEAVGAMKEALSRHAEETFQGLESDGDRKIAEQLFKALTDTDRDGRGVRRPVQIQEVCAIGEAPPSAVMRVVDRFRSPGRSFLMPPPAVPLAGDTVVDMSHESLMRNWSRLKGWSAAEAESAALYRRLSEAASLHGTGEGDLWRSPQLDIGLRWREVTNPTPAWARRYNPAFEGALSFLSKSQQARDLEVARHQEEQRQREDARREQLRLSQRVNLLMVVIFVLASALLVYFQVQGRKAEQLHRLQAALSARDPLARTLLLAELDTAGLDSGFDFAQQIVTALIPRAVLRGWGKAWIAAAFSPDDAQVLMASREGDLAWWRSDGRGEPRRCAPIRNPSSDRPAPDLTAVAFSPDMRFLAAGFKDGTVLLRGVDPATGPARVLDSDPGHQSVSSLAFSPDGQKVAVGREDYKVTIWSVEDGAAVVLGSPDSRHTGPVYGLGFAPDGKRVVSASWDKTARIWDLESGTLSRRLDAGEHGILNSAAFSSDGQWVVCASADGSVLIWKSDGTGERILLPGRGRAARSATFAPTGPWVAASYDDRTAQVWEFHPGSEGERFSAATPKVLEGHGGSVIAAIFDHRGGEVATLSEDRTARIWPLSAGEPRILGKHEKRVEKVAFSADGTRLVSASDDGSARVWSLDGSSEPVVLKRSTKDDAAWVREASFDPTGTQVLTAVDESGMSSLWDLKRGTARVLPLSSSLLGAAFDATGSRFVTADRDGGRVWALGAGDPTLVAELKGHQGWVWKASFSPDGTQVVSASRDGTARVWTLESPPSSRPLVGHSDQVLSAAFGPDARRVVTASGDSTARIWALDESDRQTTLHHQGAVNDAEFSSNGLWVVTASSDRTARVWSASGGEQRLSFRHEYPVWSAAFSPLPAGARTDPAYVATGSEDGTVRLWRASLAAFVEYARSASTGCLSAEERIGFLAEPESRARQRFADCEANYGRQPPRN
jgi:WD40 repeat protein